MFYPCSSVFICRQKLNLVFILSIWLLFSGQSVRSQEIFQDSKCPADLETLTNLLLKDLPSYANRVIQRSISQKRSINLTSYVIVAGQPEFKPLPLNSHQYKPILPNTTSQVFFTTLERQYGQDKAVEMQNYYWLFLTPTSKGWELVMLFTQLASLNQKHPPLPPQETSEGIVGQAVRLWLRDCRAGTLRNYEL